MPPWTPGNPYKEPKYWTSVNSVVASWRFWPKTSTEPDSFHGNRWYETALNMPVRISQCHTIDCADPFIVLSNWRDGWGWPPEFITGSILYQNDVYLYQGDVVSCYYFFGTYEYREPLSDYNDIGVIYLRDAAGNYYPLVEISVVEVGKNNCMQYWEKASFIVPHNGPYQILIEVLDQGPVNRDMGTHKDGPSFFLVDKFSVCSSFSSLADINNDCEVNFKDLAILCKCWTGDLTLREIGENIFCGSSDLNDDSRVNCDDLAVIEQSWLE